MARKLAFDYTFNKAAKQITIRGNVDFKRLLLINNATANIVIYNVGDPALKATAVDYVAATETTTITLNYDTTGMNNSDVLQIFTEQDGVEIKPIDTLLDPVSKFRVSEPNTLIDTDFEYGLQATKWETLERVNNVPGYYSISGDTPLTNIADVTTNGSKIVTVICTSPHGLTSGIPIDVRGVDSVTAEGTFLVRKTTDLSFTYETRTVQPGSPSVPISINTAYITITTGRFYVQSQIPFDNSASIDEGPVVTDEQPLSTLTVTTPYRHGFKVGSPFYLTNTLSNKKVEFGSAKFINGGAVDDSVSYQLNTGVFDPYEPVHYGTSLRTISSSDIANNILTIPNHGLVSGDPITYLGASAAAAAPTIGASNAASRFTHGNTTMEPWNNGTGANVSRFYFVYVLDNDTFRIATNPQDAIDGKFLLNISPGAAGSLTFSLFNNRGYEVQSNISSIQTLAGQSEVRVVITGKTNKQLGIFPERQITLSNTGIPTLDGVYVVKSISSAFTSSNWRETDSYFVMEGPTDSNNRSTFKAQPISTTYTLSSTTAATNQLLRTKSFETTIHPTISSFSTASTGATVGVLTIAQLTNLGDGDLPTRVGSIVRFTNAGNLIANGTAINTASFSGTVAGTTLTLTTNVSGVLNVGQSISGGTLAANTFITAIGGLTTGSTITLSDSATIATATPFTVSGTINFFVSELTSTSIKLSATNPAISVTPVVLSGTLGAATIKVFRSGARVQIHDGAVSWQNHNRVSTHDWCSITGKMFTREMIKNNAIFIRNHGLTSGTPVMFVGGGNTWSGGSNNPVESAGVVTVSGTTSGNTLTIGSGQFVQRADGRPATLSVGQVLSGGGLGANVTITAFTGVGAGAQITFSGPTNTNATATTYTVSATPFYYVDVQNKDEFILRTSLTLTGSVYGNPGTTTVDFSTANTYAGGVYQLHPGFTISNFTKTAAGGTDPASGGQGRDRAIGGFQSLPAYMTEKAEIIVKSGIGSRLPNGVAESPNTYSSYQKYYARTIVNQAAGTNVAEFSLTLADTGSPVNFTQDAVANTGAGGLFFGCRISENPYSNSFYLPNHGGVSGQRTTYAHPRATVDSQYLYNNAPGGPVGPLFDYIGDATGAREWPRVSMQLNQGSATAHTQINSLTNGVRYLMVPVTDDIFKVQLFNPTVLPTGSPTVQIGINTSPQAQATSATTSPGPFGCLGLSFSAAAVPNSNGNRILLPLEKQTLVESDIVRYESTGGTDIGSAYVGAPGLVNGNLYNVRNVSDFSPVTTGLTTTVEIDSDATLINLDQSASSAIQVGNTLFTGAYLNERMLVTNVAGNTITVQRGYNGTTAKTIPAGTTLYKIYGSFQLQIRDLATPRTFSGGNGTASATTDQWNITNHGLRIGETVFISGFATGGSITNTITGQVITSASPAAGPFFAIVIDANNFQLGMSRAAAFAAFPLDITNIGSAGTWGFTQYYDSVPLATSTSGNHFLTNVSSTGTIDGSYDASAVGNSTMTFSPGIQVSGRNIVFDPLKNLDLKTGTFTYQNHGLSTGSRIVYSRNQNANSIGRSGNNNNPRQGYNALYEMPLAAGGGNTAVQPSTPSVGFTTFNYNTSNLIESAFDIVPNQTITISGVTVGGSLNNGYNKTFKVRSATLGSVVVQDTTTAVADPGTGQIAGTYYVIRRNLDSFQLAYTKEDALAGRAIQNYSTTGTTGGTQGHALKTLQVTGESLGNGLATIVARDIIVNGSSTSAVLAASDRIVFTGHGFITGDRIIYQVWGNGRQINGLVSGRQYFINNTAGTQQKGGAATNQSANQFSLHNTWVGAYTNTDLVDILGAGIGTLHQFKVTNPSLRGTTFKGEWNNTDSYLYGDVVLFRNNFYMSVIGAMPPGGTGTGFNIGQQPVQDSDGRASIDWMLLPSLPSYTTKFLAQYRGGDAIKLSSKMPIKTLFFSGIVGPTNALTSTTTGVFHITGHGLSTGDAVVYKLDAAGGYHQGNNGNFSEYTSNLPQTSYTGLKVNEIYYVNVLNDNEFTLHQNPPAAFAGGASDPVIPSASGTGTQHRFEKNEGFVFDMNVLAVNNDSDMIVTDPYPTRQITFNPQTTVTTVDGLATPVVSVEREEIYIPNHGLNTGVKVYYSAGFGIGNVIGGLQEGFSYFVIKINDDVIRLAPNLSDALTLKHINLSTSGSGFSHYLVAATYCSSSYIRYQGSGGAGTGALANDNLFGSFSGSIPVNSNQLTLTTAVTNRVRVGQALSTTAAGLPANTFIVSANADPIVSGTVLTLNNSATVAINSSFTSGSNYYLGQQSANIRDGVIQGIPFVYETQMFVRPDCLNLHRSFDGGVEISAAAAPGVTITRQTRRYFRYQSGKGLQYSTGINFSPSIDISSITHDGIAYATVTTRKPHKLKTTNRIIIEKVVTTPSSQSSPYTNPQNGLYFTVHDIIDEFKFRYQTNGIPTDINPSGFPALFLYDWSDAEVRAGMFDDQNGMFFEYNGQQLSCVRRNSTSQMAGTVSVTFKSNVVTGLGTKFQSQLVADDFVVIRGMTYKVTFVDPNSQTINISPAYRGTTRSRMIMCKVINLKVPQSQWNIDKCDGSGITGFKLDIHRQQMAYMDYSWYGAGKVRFGFKDQNGIVTYVHEFVHNNKENEAYLRSGNLPARYEIMNGNNPTYAPSLYHWGASVIMDGKFEDDKAYLFSVASGSSGSDTISIPQALAGTAVPVLSIRLAPSVDSSLIGPLGERDLINRMILKMNSTGLVIGNTNNRPASVRLILNGNLSQSAYFTNYGAPSLCQIIKHTGQIADTITGGITIFEFRAPVGATSDQKLSELVELGNSILGGDFVFPNGPDVLTLAIVPTDTVAATTVTARLTWTESQA